MISPTLSTTQLVRALTLDEKVSLVEGVDSWYTHEVPRLGVRRLCLTDGPHGVRKARAASGGFGVSDNEPATAFPTSAGLANAWDPDLVRRVGAAIGAEAAALGVDVLLAPGVNIKRHPLCGRNFEYYSEDPLLSGSLGAAFVEGVQSRGVAAVVKHFAANSNEDYRFVGDSLVDERALREIYLRQFERVVKEAAPAALMTAYNAVNSVQCAENADLISGVLRGEWGFGGLVMTDWGGTRDRVAALAAGCDLEMPGGVAHNRALVRRAVEEGLLPEETLDRAVARVLSLRRGESEPDAVAESVEDLAVEAASRSAVLLANDGTLPLGPGRLACIGEFFVQMRFQGAGSSLIRPPSVVSPRDAFDRRAVSYTYARGYRALDPQPDEALVAEAVRVARDADTVVFFAGPGDLEESEGFDRESMALPAAQRRVLDAVVATGAHVVLVLFAGAPVEVPHVDRLAAVLAMYLPGMRGGEAVAALLLGEAEPSGRLAETWPLTADLATASADWGRGPVSRYYESIYVGYRGYDTAGTAVRYPFGHGLSYTSFRHSALEVEQVDGAVVVAVDVTNAGKRRGSETVQVYVRNNRGLVFKADKELRAFTRVTLDPGETRRVRLEFPLSDLAYYDVADRDWVLENGEYAVLVAASSGDVRAEAPVTVTTGRDSRSPYPADVDRAYATPPAAVPESFPLLLGRAVPQSTRSGRLGMDTRLVDARRTVVGGLLHLAVVGRMRREYRRARRLPEGLERDAKVKNTHFLLRLMPTQSLRSMVMSSSGALPYHVAEGLALLADGHPIKAARALLRARRDKGGPR